MERDIRQVRSVQSNFTTREDGETPKISGYFAVFNSNYDIAPGMSESVAPGAFDGTLSDDIRALVNHDTTLVLGRTSAHTLELRQDEHGLWGEVSINPKDTDAMNLYERVKRGDVNQCSFGFDITDEESAVSDDGSVHWTTRDGWGNSAERRERMDKPIMLSPHDIANIFLAVCGAIVAIAAAVGVIIKVIGHFKKPDKVQDARIENLETEVKDIKKRLQEGTKHFEVHDEQMKSLENDMKRNNKLIIESLQVLIEHGIDDNNIDGLKEQKHKIDKYLLER